MEPSITWLLFALHASDSKFCKNGLMMVNLLERIKTKIKWNKICFFCLNEDRNYFVVFSLINTKRCSLQKCFDWGNIRRKKTRSKTQTYRMTPENKTPWWIELHHVELFIHSKQRATSHSAVVWCCLILQPFKIGENHNERINHKNSVFNVIEHVANYLFIH